jgi:subtilisin family serine protease
MTILRRLAIFVATSLLAVGLPLSPAGATASLPGDPPGGDVVPGSYIVTLRSGDPDAAAAWHGQRYGAAVDLVYRHALRGYAARMSEAAARALAQDPAVASVTPDTRVGITAQTLPPGIARVGATRSSAGAGDGRGAVDVDIAVIDTGIDLRHRDLNVVGGVNCIPGGATWADQNGHGTHVAGIAAARDNGSGVVGVAPGARLWSVRVLSSQGWGTDASVICGIDWVTAHSDVIEVANMSLSGAGPEGSCADGGMHEAICRSTEAGVTYVVAAGNSASDAGSAVPATFDEVITVSAIADFDGLPGGVGAPTCAQGVDDTFARFSNFGPDVDLAAPGVCVLSTWRGNTLTPLSGTSMASPHVAGGAALYLSNHPGALPAEVRDALVSAGTHGWVGDPDGIPEPLLDVSGF